MDFRKAFDSVISRSLSAEFCRRQLPIEWQRSARLQIYSDELKPLWKPIRRIGLRPSSRRFRSTALRSFGTADSKAISLWLSKLVDPLFFGIGTIMEIRQEGGALDLESPPRQQCLLNALARKGASSGSLRTQVEIPSAPVAASARIVFSARSISSTVIGPVLKALGSAA